MADVAAPRRNRLLLSQWHDLLDDDAFRSYWFMRVANNGAANAVTYALLVFTVRHSQNAIATGGLLLTIIVPSAVLGAFAGVVVDRLPRGLILFLSFILRAVLVFLLTGAKDDLLGLYTVSLGISIVAQFSIPAEQAVLPQIVSGDRFTAANSFINLGCLVAQVLGALALGPALLKTTNGDPLLFILAGLFVLSAVLVTVIPQFHFLPGPEHRVTEAVRGARRDFAESWMTLTRDPIAYLSLILLVVANISVIILTTLIPKFATQVLHVAPEDIVFVLAPAAIGVFLGLRLVQWLTHHLNKLVTISGSYLAMAGSLVALGLVPLSGRIIEDIDPAGLFSSGPLNEKVARIAATIVYANVYGFAYTVVITMGRVLIYERIPHDMQGRVFAAQSVLANLLAIVPVLLAGVLADAVGVAPVLIAGGLVAVLAAAWTQMQSSRAVPARRTGIVPRRKREDDPPASRPL